MLVTVVVDEPDVIVGDLPVITLVDLGDATRSGGENDFAPFFEQVVERRRDAFVVFRVSDFQLITSLSLRCSLNGWTDGAGLTELAPPAFIGVKFASLRFFDNLLHSVESRTDSELIDGHRRRYEFLMS